MSSAPAFVSDASLSSPEGALVSIAIRVEARCLEALLEALAGIGFPINPQIFHDAEVLLFHADGSEETAVVTLVEFPAYLERVAEVYGALESNGFDRGSMLVTSMLDQLRCHTPSGPAALLPAWAVRTHQRSSTAH